MAGCVVLESNLHATHRGAAVGIKEHGIRELRAITQETFLDRGLSLRAPYEIHCLCLVGLSDLHGGMLGAYGSGVVCGQGRVSSAGRTQGKVVELLGESMLRGEEALQSLLQHSEFRLLLLPQGCERIALLPLHGREFVFDSL